MVDCIVSLTTWTKRISNPVLIEVLNSVVHQETKYGFQIVLVLSLAEFPGRETGLPSELVEFIHANNIELLWTEDDLKAYKKLYPVQKKYPELPIMTMDDDIMLEPTCVETFMDEHIANPEQILSEGGREFSPDGDTLTGTFRLFPPHSLPDIDSLYFKYWFQCCEDDAYLAVLAWAKGTQTKILKTGLAKEIQNPELKTTALRKQYRKIDNRLCKINLLRALKKTGLINKPIDGIIARYKKEQEEKEKQRQLRLQRIREKHQKQLEESQKQKQKQKQGIEQNKMRSKIHKPITIRHGLGRKRQSRAI